MAKRERPDDEAMPGERRQASARHEDRYEDRADGRPDDRIDDERMDEENILKPEYVRSVRESLEAGDDARVYELVEPLHPADIADLLELFERDERHQLAAAITDLMTSDVVAELNDFVRDDMMESLPAARVASIAEQLDTDDAVQLIEDLDRDNQRAILAELDAEDRHAIESALAYPDETAGRLMNLDFVAVPEHLTVGDLIDFLREDRALPNDFFEIGREVCGELVEKMELVDEFTNPKKGKTSHCYRITYRSMERSLTDEEDNKMQEPMREKAESVLKVELR